MARHPDERQDDDHGHGAARGLGRQLARESQAAVDCAAVGTLVRRGHGRHACRNGYGRACFRRRLELPRGRWQARTPVRHRWRRSGGADAHPVRRRACTRIALSMAVSVMDGFDIRDSLFAHYILANAPLEQLAGGFRWVEGLVWIGDADCLLFQDLPRDRTMRWIEDVGVSVYRSPSGYANGQKRDRQGRLVWCSHRERALFRTELDASITRLADRHDGPLLNSPYGVV